jgi:hypothetical protein
MKKALVLASVPLMVVSSIAVIAIIALIKAVEESHDDQFFWE